MTVPCACRRPDDRLIGARLLAERPDYTLPPVLRREIDEPWRDA